MRPLIKKSSSVEGETQLDIPSFDMQIDDFCHISFLDKQIS